MTGSLQIRNGKFYAVTRINGKQKWINLNIEAKRGNRKEAEVAMARVISAIDDNPNVFEKIDFAEYMKIWLKDVKKHIDIVTYEGYKQYTEKHIIPYFEKHKRTLQEMRTADIEAYYEYKSKGGRLDSKPGGLSKKTIRSHSIPISLAFKQAMRDGIINRNPCEYARLPKMDTVRKEITFYTVEDIKKLFEIIKGTVLYDMVYITFMYGLRRSELMGIKWNAVDFESNTITIQHTVEVQTNLIIVKDSTKNKSSNRVYPLLSDVKEILLRIKAQQEEYKDMFGNCYTDTDYVFARPDGKMYYPSYPSKLLKKALLRNNLKYIRFHDLRHSCASMLIMKGWQMKDISDWLGHADIGTTMNIYGHLNMEYKRKLAKQLENIL